MARSKTKITFVQYVNRKYKEEMKMQKHDMMEYSNMQFRQEVKKCKIKQCQ